MTEQQWLSCADPAEMLEFLRGGGTSDRKLRLFAVACCRTVWPFLGPEARDAADAVERLTDSGADPREFNPFRRLAQRAWLQAQLSREQVHPRGAVEEAACREYAIQAVEAAADINPATAAAQSARKVVLLKGRSTGVREAGPGFEDHDAYSGAVVAGRRMAAERLGEVARDIFGPNPLRPVTFGPDWRTGTVVALARQMYETRDFSSMNVMADAMQDAGCENEDVQNHCRGPNVHVRGCWVVDLVLGKA